MVISAKIIKSERTISIKLKPVGLGFTVNLGINFIVAGYSEERKKLRDDQLAEPREGFEPTTHCLQNSCSTTELSRLCRTF